MYCDVMGWLNGMFTKILPNCVRFASDTDALLWTRRHFVCDNTENYAVDKGNPMGAPAGETYLQLQSGQYQKPSAICSPDIVSSGFSGAACLLLPAEPAWLPVGLPDGPG